jgi:hypothetical protein
MDEKIERTTLENDGKIAESISCPTHGKTCYYHASYDDDGYHAIAICRRCGWRKEF